MAVVAAASGGVSNALRVRRAVTRAGKALTFDEGLEQHERMGILRLPVAAYLPSDTPENMTGQVRHLHPGHDEEAHVVRHQRQGTFSPRWVPADKALSGGHLPCRSAEEQAREHPTLTVVHEVMQILSHGPAIAEVVVALDQGTKELTFLARVRQRVAQRYQRAQRRAYRRLLNTERPHGAMAKRVVGRTHRRGQGNEPFGIELAQQRPRGHVLGLSVRRDPIPPLAKRLGQLGAMPTRMRRDQRTHEPDVIVAERAPLDDSVRCHGEQRYSMQLCESRPQNRSCSSCPRLLRNYSQSY